MPKRPLPEEELTSSIIAAFLEVYRILDYGYPECLHTAALEYELRLRGHRVDREVEADVRYKSVKIGKQRLDVVVDDKVIVEVKSTERLHPSARRQLLGYLKATRFDIGLLLHFGPEPKFLRVDAPPRRSDW
jgi:GxxExxY protein